MHYGLVIICFLVLPEFGLGKGRTDFGGCFPCKQYIENLDLPAGMHLDPIWNSPALSGTHYFYQLYFRNIPIWNAGILFHHLNDTLLRDAILPKREVGSTVETDIIHEDRFFVQVSNSFELVDKRYVFNNQTGAGHLEFRDMQGRTVLIANSLRYQNHLTRRAYVFNPNPIHSSGTSYGEVYTDRNDAMYPELQNEMKEVNIEIDQLPYYLQFKDRSPPAYSTDILRIDSLSADRSQPEFECVQVLYHISRFVQHLRSIGFKDSIDLIQIDPHALAGADRSAFDPFADPPSIQFGVGGVDDAEDAQVIIHEFCHALIHQLNPYSYQGTERRIMEEAIADYFALSYSYLLNGNTSRKVFSWDAHNPFWSGYTARNHFAYCPTSDERCLRESWTGFFLEYAHQSGFETVDRVLLNFLPLLIPNGSTQTQAARLIWLCEQMGLNIPTSILLDCGFLDPAFTAPAQFESNRTRILHGTDCLLELTDIQYINWDLIDLNGRVIHSGREIGSMIRLPAEYLGGKASMYWLKVLGIAEAGSRPVERIMRILYLP
ncbi:MAG: hypothetical protein H6606_09670 [Flavobacteriales bacterium]|nr:hypothetical protein [Flavobacteriales bacterium]